MSGVGWCIQYLSSSLFVLLTTNIKNNNNNNTNIKKHNKFTVVSNERNINNFFFYYFGRCYIIFIPNTNRATCHKFSTCNMIPEMGCCFIISYTFMDLPLKNKWYGFIFGTRDSVKKHVLILYKYFF